MGKATHPIRIAIRGRRAQISLHVQERSLEEWNHVRKAAFAKLRQFRVAPRELLDLVEHFKEQALIQLVGKTAGAAELRLGAKVIGTKHTTNIVQLAGVMTARKRIGNEETNSALTASECLAFFLRISLRELKCAERKREGAPVRTLNLVPRSVIAEIAMDLLDSCETWNHPPGPNLNILLRELLDLESRKQEGTRLVDKQEQAIFIVAQAPTFGTRLLAKILHVEASTVSRWRRSPEFKTKVQSTARWIASLNANVSGTKCS